LAFLQTFIISFSPVFSALFIRSERLPHSLQIALFIVSPAMLSVPSGLIVFS
jgi:hypothetical protein